MAVTGTDGCKSFSNAFEWTLNLAIEQQDGFRVFPNPSSEMIYIEAFAHPIKSISLIDPLGQILLQRNINAKKTTLDISGIAPGNYFIQLYQGNKLSVTKISVQ